MHEVVASALTIHPCFFLQVRESKSMLSPKTILIWGSRGGGDEKRMSAFMVADETINRVVYWLYFEVMNRQWLRDKLEQAIGIDTTNYRWSEALGKAMFDLNIAGV